MENVLLFIQNHLPFLIEYRYLFIFIGVSIEGINSTILAGFLASVGSISFWPAFLICVAGEIVNASLWYTVGYFAGAKPIDKWGRKDEKSRKIIEKVDEYFKKYSGRAIVFAKLTWSLTIATMITAGSLKYDFKRFTLYNFLGSVGWVGIIFTMGFFFGESYKLLFDYLKNLTFILLFLGGAITAAYILKMIFRSAYVRTLLIGERLKDLNEKLKTGIDKLFSEPDDDDLTK